MKTHQLFLVFLFALIILSGTVKAQFSIDAEYRPRYEYRNGYKRLPDQNTSYAMLVSQRTRLSFLYTWKFLKMKVTAQDVRLWGEEKLKADNPAFGVYEAWAEIRIVDSLCVRIGRQELVYDNQRLFSNNNWNQNGQVHDLILLKYSRKGWKADLGGAFNQNKDTLWGTYYSGGAIKGNYKTLSLLRVSKQYKAFDFSVLAAGDGFQKEGIQNALYMRGTYGGSVQFNSRYISPVIRGFYQNGKDVTGKTISAYYLNADISIQAVKFFNAVAGCEFFSGKDIADTSDKKVRSFFPLYGSNHNFNGSIDYITDLQKHTGNSGLIDAYLKLTFKPHAKISLLLDYHYFSLLYKYTSKGKLLSRNYGHEIDLSCKIDFIKEVSLQAGYSAMLGTKTMAAILGGDQNKLGQWAWCMLIIKPTIFSFTKPN
jgi:hypothetical protein